MRNIKQLIEKGEGLTTEFKSSFDSLPETLFDTVCAFLNRQGGEIVLGTGIKNVYKYSKAYFGSEIISFKEDDVFITTVPIEHIELEANEPVNDENGPVNGPVNDENGPVNKRYLFILELMTNNKNISKIDLSIKYKVGLTTIKRDILTLKKQGLIKRIGSDKKGYWEVLI
jgi:ATP-dependent DNA helicase RecG